MRKFYQNVCNCVLTFFLVTLLMPFTLMNAVAVFVRKAYFRCGWYLKHGRYGRKFLVVYSNDKRWREYFQSEIVPLICSSAVIVNVSERGANRNSLERKTFRCWAGSQNDMPIVLFFSVFGRITEFRFLQAFMDVQDFNDNNQLNTLRSELQLFSSSVLVQI